MKYLPILFCILILSIGTVNAEVTDLKAADASHLGEAERIRYEQLAKDMRCVVCQNQSIWKSNAPLAKNLRAVIITQIEQGKSDKQVKGYITARYGEQVLLRPKFSAANFLLWFGPVLFFAAAIVTFMQKMKQPVEPLLKEKLKMSEIEQKALAEKLKKLSEQSNLTTKQQEKD